MHVKRLFLGFACALTLLGAAAAHAEATHAAGGLGFHSSSAPVGGRWWFAGQKVGLDAGLGFSSTPSSVSSKEKETGWSIDAGVPIVMKSWEGVHVLFRPGLNYSSQQVGFDSDGTTPGVQFDTVNQTAFTVSGEIEAEVFLRDNFSVSASHGIAFSSVNPPDFPGGPSTDSITSFSTIGNNFTQVGFHVYFLGGDK
jgi:hypothetical protein